MRIFYTYLYKKGTPKSSLTLYHPIVGAVKATGVASTDARSRGKL
jgi:hypothetical protein